MGRNPSCATARSIHPFILQKLPQVRFKNFIDLEMNARQINRLKPDFSIARRGQKHPVTRKTHAGLDIVKNHPLCTRLCQRDAPPTANPRMYCQRITLPVLKIAHNTHCFAVHVELKFLRWIGRDHPRDILFKIEII